MFCKDKGEIERKTFCVSLDLFVESFGGNAIQLSQLEVEHNSNAANDMDTAFDLDLNEFSGVGFGFLRRHVASRWAT